MVSPIPANNLLQSYVATKTKPDTKTSALPQPVVDAAAQQSSESTKVSFSPAAQEKLKRNLSLNTYQHQMSEAKKARARERAAEIKQRVDELKRLVSLLGALAPKALLRELKQLANELKSTANELKEGWGGSAGTAIGGSLTGTEPESTTALSEPFEESTTDNTGAEQQDTAQAADEATSGEDEQAPDEEKAAQSDASTATSLSQQTEKEQSQQQRREDQRLLQETAQELQSLFNRLKALLRTEDNDKETQKQLGEIEKLLTDTHTIANELTSGIEASMPEVNIAISV